MASYAPCSLFLISKSGSAITFVIVSREFVTAGGGAALSFVNVSTPPPPPGLLFSCCSFLNRIPSILLFPRRYPSISSAYCPVAVEGAWYIQSTRFCCRDFPESSCRRCRSCIWRSSSRSRRSCSIRFRSSRAFCSSDQTRSWLRSSEGCHDLVYSVSPCSSDRSAGGGEKGV